MSKNATPLPRQVADSYVDALVALDPITGTYLGVPESSQPASRSLPRGPGSSRRTEPHHPGDGSTRPRSAPAPTATRSGAAHGCCASGSRPNSPCTTPRRGCARSSNLHSPVHSVRGGVHRHAHRDTTRTGRPSPSGCAPCPTRSRATAQSLDARSGRKGLHAGPRQVATFLGQLDEWTGESDGDGQSWFADFAAEGPEALRAELDEAAATDATAAVAELRDWMRDVYAPGIAGAPTTIVGRERYALLVALLERHRPGPGRGVRVRLVRIPPAARPRCAPRPRRSCRARPLRGRRCAISTSTARHIEGVEEVRDWLQGLMDEAIEKLDGTHFELAERVEARRVQDRSAGRRRGAVLHAARRWTSPVRAAPGCRRWARPASRSTTWSPPGTTRVCRATTSSSRSGCTSRTSSPATRRRSAWSAPTPRAGRCTRSGSWTSWASSPTPSSGSAIWTRR